MSLTSSASAKCWAPASPRSLSVSQSVTWRAQAEALILSNCGIGDCSLRELTTALEGNRTLPRLDAHNGAGGEPHTPTSRLDLVQHRRGGRTSACCLVGKNRVLDLSGNSIGDAGTKPIAEALRSNQALASPPPSGDFSSSLDDTPSSRRGRASTACSAWRVEY